MSDTDTRLAPGASPGGQPERPGAIDAVPVRHPWRWVAVAVLLVLLAKVLGIVVGNPAFDWSFIGQAMIQSPVIRGLLLGTLLGTVCAMVGSVILGVILAVMRLSENKVLSILAWGYIWFFRAIPRYVLLFMMGAIGALWPDNKGGLSLGVPFGPDIMHALGFSGKLTFLNLDANHLFSGLVGGIIGLILSEAAYMAEIARAGILSVDDGQREAACALGMSNGLAMRRVVLPQAMRVIVPPTGNETIAMLKDTVLMTAIPVNSELFFQLSQIGARTFQAWGTAVAAVIWYLIICSILMYVQMHVERYFGRGFGGRPPGGTQGFRAKMLGLSGGMSR
ncbi:amino acid ABC transporter permease [Nocardioides terrisoli]|uniref:amino acid ABC transporter permease n=1 Tax=Nocardioides terrisoli TaxID=3388267 RepID=UPI00287B86AE|nr:amino acid ABC transporter permease [Nocardioides marmorisolisilvae]